MNATADPTTALPTSQPPLHALVANIQDAIVLLDATGRVVFESPAASAILGIPADDVLGAFGLKRIHPDERDAVVREFERTIATPGAVARATYRFQRADGRWQHLEALAKNLLDDPALRGVLITFRDVTERTHALAAAERAARTTDDFLEMAAHEIRTPLRAILGWTRALKAANPAIAGDAIGQIERATQQLEEVVRDALAFERSGDAHGRRRIERISVAGAVDEALGAARTAAAKLGATVATAADVPDDTVVLADAGRLDYVLATLILAAARSGRGAGEVRVGWRGQGELVRIVVRSAGAGLSGYAIETLFERFERLGMEDAGGETVGLGIAIANRLVQMMNGSLGLASGPGEGLLFWIELPGG